MRIITPKDKKGLLAALRAFARELSGERVSQKTGEWLLNQALGAGVTVDALLNRQNWGRAAELDPSITIEGYVEMLAQRRFPVRDLKEDPMWHEPEGGFALVAEAAHDFFMAVTGRGGRWNIPSALRYLAKAISEHSLQAVLSEELIAAVEKDEPEVNYFGYIQAISEDFKSLPVDDSLTEEQELMLQSHGEKQTIETVEEVEDPQDADPDPEEDEPYPEKTDEQDEEPQPEFETMFFAKSSPREMKRACLRNVLEGYSPIEVGGIIRTIEGGENKVLSEILDDLVDGRFDPKLENSATREVHRSICADLLPTFIDCVRLQGIEMDEQIASHFDVLHDSWDLRTPEVRKLHKLKTLILTYGGDDEDLASAIREIEELYSDKG